MKAYKATVLKVAVNLPIPESIEEFDQLAKKEGAALEAAIKQELFHGAYGDVRAKVSELLVKSGRERKAIKTETREKTDPETGEVTTEEVVTAWETDGAFFNRICAEEAVEPDHFTDLVQQAADMVPFDPSKRERTAKAKKVGKSYIDAATEIAQVGQLENVAAKLAELLGEPVDVSAGGDEAIEALGRAMQANDAKEKKSIADKYASL